MIYFIVLHRIYTVLIHLCSFRSSERDAAMTVVDVGLLTGFKVDENDLSKVKMLSDCKRLTTSD